MARHSSIFTGSETAANLNSANAKTVTVKAKWKSQCASGITCTDVDLAINGTKDFSYTGTVQGATLKKAGRYKLEVWGAQGGNGAINTYGGPGGYSYGTYTASSGVVLYVVVGSQGVRGQYGVSVVKNGGYNGGGNSGLDHNHENGSACLQGTGGGGGGATHISSKEGVLSTLSSSKDTILLVAGGGGGAVDESSSITSKGYGGSGGGYQGGDGYGYGEYNSCDSAIGCQGHGGTQSSGGQGGVQSTYGNGNAGSFGQGGNGNQINNRCGAGAGGGGGYYGGGSGAGGYEAGGGGGSGYINTSKLQSGSFRMYCGINRTYGSCPTNTSNYTYGTSSTSSHVANAANTGNGYARITYLGT